MGSNEVGSIGMGCNGMGWDGMGPNGMQWDGTDPHWDTMGGVGRPPPLPPPAAHQVLSEAKAPCFRVLRDGRCALPTLRNITRQICCCSRVGKAWGRDCLRCPPYGSGQTPQQHSEPEGTP